MNQRLSIRLIASVILSLVCGACVAGVSSADNISLLLERKTAPEGVVFEVVSSESGLRWAIPLIRAHVTALRKKWPTLKIAVVSHGNEQFALTKANQVKFKQVHQQVKDLTSQLKIPVHICQTYAANKGVSPEAFPKYITVSTQGPQEIKNYIEFGYVLVVVTK